MKKMVRTCPNCGLPEELCVCKTVTREAQHIRVYTEKKRFGKYVTVIEGVRDNAELKELTKKLKSKLACGGTCKDGRIELQGNHKAKMPELLAKSGFAKEQIDVQ